MSPMYTLTSDGKMPKSRENKKAPKVLALPSGGCYTDSRNKVVNKPQAVQQKERKMVRTYKAEVRIKVEIKASNAAEAEEILHNVYGVDNGSFEIKAVDCDVDLVGNFAKI